MKKKDIIAGLRKHCAELGIQIPRFATPKKLGNLIDDYYKSAAVVTTNEGLRFRQTSNATAEYTVYFTVSGYHTIRAESEDAAREWMEDGVADYYQPRFGSVADKWGEVHEVSKDED